MKKGYMVGLGATAVAIAAGAVVSIGNTPEADAAHHRAYAVAVIHGAQGHENITGTVTLTESASGVEVTAEISNVPPGMHGFHIHEYGDLSAPDLTSAGGHYNPTEQPHACPPTAARHVGDMGNVEADSNGDISFSHTFDNVSLAGQYSVIGRAVILHGGEDDCESQPSGDAGPRIAGGVIGLGARR